MQPSQTTTGGKLIALAVAVSVLMVAGIGHVFSPRVVARASAPDGTELRVIQTASVGIEFNTEVFFRRPGGSWGRFYYDHSDFYWGRGRAEVDAQTKRITIYRSEQVTATFDWETGRYQLLRPNRAHLDYSAQWGREPPAD